MKKKICHTTLHGVKPSEQGVPEISALSSTSPPGGGHLFQEQPHFSLLPYTCTLHLCKTSPLDHHLCPSFLFITASHCTTINKYLENFNACNPNVCIISWSKRLQTIPYSKLGKVGTTRSHQDKLNCLSISIKSPTTKCKSWMSPHGKASSVFQVNLQWTNPSMLGPCLVKAQDRKIITTHRWYF